MCRPISNLLVFQCCKNVFISKHILKHQQYIFRPFMNLSDMKGIFGMSVFQVLTDLYLDNNMGFPQHLFEICKLLLRKSAKQHFLCGDILNNTFVQV